MAIGTEIWFYLQAILLQAPLLQMPSLSIISKTAAVITISNQPVLRLMLGHQLVHLQLILMAIRYPRAKAMISDRMNISAVQIALNTFRHLQDLSSATTITRNRSTQIPTSTL